jgi:hypothetical protein
MSAFFSIPAVDPWKSGFDPEFYYEIPDDWVLFTAEIVDSAGLVKAGKAEDITFVATAGIAAAANAVSGWLPSHFGGDGWSIAMPEDFADRVLPAMRGVVKMALRDHEIKVRYMVGRAADCPPLFVSRVGYPSASSWIFRGEGFRYLESLSRNGSDGLPNDGEADLSGLQCRWAPIQSKHGVMFSFAARCMYDDQVDRDQAHVSLLRKISNYANTPDLLTAMPKSRWLRPLNFLMKSWRQQMASSVILLQINDSFSATLDITKADADYLDSVFARAEDALHLSYATTRAPEVRIMSFTRSLSEHLHFCDATVSSFRGAQVGRSAMKRLGMALPG